MDIKQIKKVHGLQGKSVKYGVLEVKTRGGQKKLKPALWIRGSRQYFDFFEFKFYTQVELSEITRKVYPAQIKKSGGEIHLIAEGEREIDLPRNYFDKLYERLIYNEELVVL